MGRFNAECPPQNRVTAVFEASALSFELPLAATLEDLAARLADRGDHHNGPLISLNVRLQLPARC